MTLAIYGLRTLAAASLVGGGSFIVYQNSELNRIRDESVTKINDLAKQRDFLESDNRILRAENSHLVLTQQEKDKKQKEKDAHNRALDDFLLCSATLTGIWAIVASGTSCRGS